MKKRQLAVSLLALSTLALSGCRSSKTVALVGAGSTFIYPAMSRWAAGYMRAHPDVQVNYQSIGSGGGIEQVRVGTVDFGASDFPLTDEALRSMPPVIQFPESAGPVVITYNLPALRERLRLSGSTLAGIYLGAIRNWRDRSIEADNPGVVLPDRPIVVVHRAETSGTTFALTAYLSAVSPAWKSRVGVGGSVGWPVGIGGKGNEGVTGQLRQSAGAIGYVELAYAVENHLPVASVKNLAGNYVVPSVASAAAAIGAFAAAVVLDPRTPIVNPPAAAADAYPITTLTFLIVPEDGADRVSRQALKGFFTYVVTEGQFIAGRLNYARLPEAVREYDLRQIGRMTAGGKPLG